MSNIRKLLVTHGVIEHDVRLSENDRTKICENPYEVPMFSSVPFATIDKIAMSLDIEDHVRCAARCVHYIKSKEEDGHTCVDINEIHDHLQSNGFGLSVRDMAIHNLLMQHKCYIESANKSQYVYRSCTYTTERSIISRVKELCAGRDIDIDRDLLAVCGQEVDIELTQQQIEAVVNGLSKRISIIVGPAGCGKTASVKVMKKMCDKIGISVVFAAPTGAAAKRIREQFVEGEIKACTIHKLLEAVPNGKGFRFLKNEKNPLQCDIIVIDETSMIDLWLMNSLLKAMKPGHTRLVILGDPNQLPSVGCGKILKDILLSEIVPTTVLSKIMRQAEGSNIVKAAHGVISGNIVYEPGKHGDFEWIQLEDELDIIETVHRYSMAWDDNMGVQVLCPRKTSGGVNTEQLNKMLQKIFNGRALQYQKEKGASTGVLDDCRYSVGDRVIFLKNDAELELLNGDKGIVRKIDWIDIQKKAIESEVQTNPSNYDEIQAENYINLSKKRGKQSGRFKKSQQAQRSHWRLTVEYDDGALHQHRSGDPDIDLRYALTVHKSQGDQYSRVIVVLQKSHGLLLQREMLYTAITRAKHELVLIASRDCLERCISNIGCNKRLSLLSCLLSKEEIPEKQEESTGRNKEIHSFFRRYSFKKI
jgi:exodeoxyribonuclease V alpha subunit